MSLVDGIREMFAELDGRERMWDMLERVGALRSDAEYSYLKEWRAKNREKVRAYNRKSSKVWAKRNPEARSAAKQRYRDKYPDRARVIWRRSARKRREREREKTGTVVRVYRCRQCGVIGHNVTTCPERRTA